MRPFSPSSGYFQEHTHIFPLRVYIQHTDIGGIVYHSRYLDFAEQARTEFLRLLEVPHHLLSTQEKGFIVVHSCHISYLKPARLDDCLAVHTTLKHVGGASIVLEQDTLCDTVHLVTIKIRLVWIKSIGVVGRLPPVLFDRLTHFLATQPPTEGV